MNEQEELMETHPVWESVSGTSLADPTGPFG